MTTAKLSVLHVVVRAGATNSQYNEHCLPVLGERRITVCSLFPADVTPPADLRLVEGTGSVRGCFRALRRALSFGPYDVVHVHAPASGVLTLATYVATRRSRRDLVFTVHNSWPNFKLRNKLFLYVIFALFPVVVTCGSSVRASLPRLVRGLWGRRITVVQNGVDLDRVDRCRALAAADGEPPVPITCVSVNRLIPLKDPATVLEGFARARRGDDHLVLVGEGVLRPDITAALHDAGLTGSVTLTGLVDRDDVYRILSHAGAFVSASRGEGLPVSVLEAMACRCPVVLSDIPPHREIARLAPGIPLFEPGDTVALATALARVRDLGPAAREELADQARRCVEENFSVHSMNRSYGNLYGRVVARNTVQSGPRHRPGRVPIDPDLPLVRKMVHRWHLILALTLLGAAAGFGYSQVRAPVYEANSSIVVGEVFGGAPTGDSVKASAALAASYADLARREPILRPVAKSQGIEDWRTLQTMVHAKPGDKNPLLVLVQVTADSTEEAEGIAEAVAEQLVKATSYNQIRGTTFAEQEIKRLDEDIAQAQARITALQKRLDAAAGGSTAEALAADLQDLRKSLLELHAGRQDMIGQFVTAGAAGEVRIVEHAYATKSPLQPDPLLLSAAGLAAGLALAAAWLHLAGGPPRLPGPSVGTPEVVGADVRPMRAGSRGPDATSQENPQRGGGRR
jgi:glycosyltransferase involved in cell wall biosynthesis/capsular polysaccharide biosynthesis protein